MNIRAKVLVVCGLVFGLFGPANGQTPEVGAYKHAYYLFIAPPADACEACYVPLLLTSRPLEEVTRRSESETCVILTTYERDSLVRMERGVQLLPADVKVAERHIRIRGRMYRYQEVGAAEVIGLLERPNGTIPISRTHGMSVLRKDLEDLITSFRAIK
jgi:hypothetical protein